MAIIYNKTEKKMKDSYGELLSFMIFSLPPAVPSTPTVY